MIDASRVLPWRAAVGLALAVLLVGAAVASLGGRLLPAGGGPAVALIWVVSVLVLAGGIVHAAIEVRWLAREYRALGDAVRPGYIAMEPSGPARHAAGDEALVARRARRVARIRADEALPPDDFRAGFRAEAAAATAGIGGTARFLASLLLLLAVLGTFAGMKDALPRLVTAIRPDAAAVDPASVRAALAAVAGAFGANFLALLGSVAMAVVAFTAGAERRSLLAALDQVSERHLYPLLPPDAGAPLLRRAVQDLRLSVSAVEVVGDGIRDLQTGIRSFERALVDALDELRASFAASLQRQSLEIQDRLSADVGRVAVHVLDVAEALRDAAAGYEALLRWLEQREQQIARAATALEVVASSVPAELERASQTLAEANQRTADAEVELRDAAERAARAHRAMDERAREVERTLADSAAGVDASAARIAAALREQGAAIAGVPQKLESTLSEALAGADIGAGAAEPGSAPAASVDELRRRVEETAADTLRGLRAVHATVQAASRSGAEASRKVHDLLAADIRQRSDSIQKLTGALAAAGRELRRLAASVSDSPGERDPRMDEIAGGLEAALAALSAMRADVERVAAAVAARGNGPERQD